MQRKLWKIREMGEGVYELARQHRISPVIAHILRLREIEGEEISSFMNPATSQLYSPFLLPDIERAVIRIHTAVQKGERVLIFGDYDVDGITSLAIFYEFAREYPNLFTFYIPHRVQEGYGLNKEVINNAKQQGVSLLIAFDCGTNAFVEIALAHSLGIDMIIIDHHLPQEGTHAPSLFINPKRSDCAYPFSDLSSAALAFKLLQTLKSCPCWDCLDLVALSLVCDVVPLKGENRILLKEGLKRIRLTERPAIKELCKVSKIKQDNIDQYHLGFILGPRINAAGRIAHAQEALDIFLSNDLKRIEELALKLHGYNKLRKNIEDDILKQVQQVIEQEDKRDFAIVVSGENWHPGVLGIVASRLVNRYYRPAFVFSFTDNVGKGSARSIHSVHLIDVLSKCSDYVPEYGGHRKAAGLEISRDGLEMFKKKVNALIGEMVKAEDLIPVLEIDAQLQLQDITISLLGEVEALKPFGEGNQSPLFASYNVCKRGQAKKISNFYSFWISDQKQTIEVIGSDKELWDIIQYGKNFDIAYALERDTYHNTIRLKLRDIRLAGGGN